MPNTLTTDDKYKLICKRFRSISVNCEDGKNFEAWISGLMVSGSDKVPFSVAAKTHEDAISTLFNELTTPGRIIYQSVPYSAGGGAHVWDAGQQNFTAVPR